MSVEQNKLTLKRLYDEVWNKGNIGVIPELVSPKFFTRGLHREFKGHEGYAEMVTNLRNTMPDIHFTIEEMVGEGDNLVYRVSGEGTYSGETANKELTGKKFKWTQALFTCYEDGKVAEALNVMDNLLWYQQTGIAPPSYELSKQ
jgi:predicted ester cyclase